MRLTRALDACCERWGSQVHYLWDEVAGWHPRRIVQRLLMREAGLAENTSMTEAVVNEISRYLLEDKGMDPFVQRDTQRREATPPAPLDLGTVLRRALRENTYTQEQAKEEAAPTCLVDTRPIAHAAVQRALANPDRLLELPFFYEDPRTRAQDRAPSVLVDAKRLWLRSGEYTDWLGARMAIFGGGTSSRDMPAFLPIEEEEPDELELV